MLAVVFVYAGLAAMLMGAVALVKPVALVRISNRRQTTMVFGGGILAVAIGALLPATETLILRQFVARLQSPRMNDWNFA